MAGLFEDILTNLQEKKQEGKISGGYRYKDGKLNIGGGYYGDDSMFEVDVNKDGGNILFKKRFADGGSTNGSGDKAFTGKVKELMDDGYEFGEAVKEAMRQGYKQGGKVKKGTKTNLTEEKFVELRLQKKNLNHKEFAEYLNTQTKYYPDPKQSDKFTNVNVDRRYNIAKSKGKFPLNFVIKGSIQDRTLTPEKYKSVIGKKDYLKLKDNPTKLKNRYEFELKKANDPNFLKMRAERNLAKTKAMSPLEYEEKILEPARKRNQKIRGDTAKFTVNRRDAKSMAWKDLVSRSYETANTDPYFKFETPVKAKKKYNTVDMKKIVLIDKNGNKFTYDTLFKDIEKTIGEQEFKSFKNTYEQRAFLNKEGITSELNKLYKIKPGQRKSVFNIQHIEGFNKNPFKVHMTFGNQNLNEAYSRKSFTADFGKADTYSQKKAAINKYYKSLGPDIVAQIGKQPRGTAKPLIELLNKAKINLQPDIKTRAISLGSFPAQLAEAPGMAKGAAKAAAKSAAKILGVAALPLEAYFMKQMYDEGKTAPEILSSLLMLEGVVGEGQRLMTMDPVERQAVTEEKIAQDETLLDTDFSQPYRQGLQSVNTEMVNERANREIEERRKAKAAQRNKTLPNQGLLRILSNPTYEGVL